MKIKLVFEKIFIADSQVYKLKDFDCLIIDQLPDQYFKEKPYVYKSKLHEEGILIINGKNCEYRIRTDFPLTINEKDNIVETCKIAGKRLKKINDEIRKSWSGTETIEI
jgi:hypothetical protein